MTATFQRPGATIYWQSRWTTVTDGSSGWSSYNSTARFEMLAEWIDTERAMDLLDVPWTTLRRLMDCEAIVARKRTQGRWIVRLDTVLNLRSKIEAEPHSWETLQPVKTDFQGLLKLG